jgi:cyclopropane fatty-acyl-phospholipid synthase-like methyltransferase
MKRHAPATERNREPILEVLARVLPKTGRVLEIGAGTGEHAVFFAAALPGLRWQPTDADQDQRASIEAHREEAALPNLLPPSALDVRDAEWGVGQVDAILSANMIHIAPFAATEGLLAGAARHLRPGGVLVLYGPFREHGAFEAPSNEAFDESLRSRNPEWGIRDLETITVRAAALGLVREERVAMPANNLLLVFRRY